MPLASGTRLAIYEIQAPIGAGGMGEVSRAMDTKLGRGVASKILPAEMAQDPDRLARFHREARAVATLNHPNPNVSQWGRVAAKSNSIRRRRQVKIRKSSYRPSSAVFVALPAPGGPIFFQGNKHHAPRPFI